MGFCMEFHCKIFIDLLYPKWYHFAEDFAGPKSLKG